MASAATSPSSVNVGGMRMSTIATSGCSLATIRRSFCASSTLPTTSRPAALEQACCSLPQEHCVVGDHDAHGISARTVSREARRARRATVRPARRSDPRDRSTCPPARSRRRCAPSTPTVITSESPTRLASTAAFVAPAWTATGPVISAMRKYAADSTEPGNRSSGRLVTLIGIEARSRSASTAAPSPSLVMTAG